MRLPNGFGSIVFLGKKRRKPYAVRITTGWSDSGKQIYKYLGYFEKKSQALESLVEYNKNPYDLDSVKITFKEVFDKWSERAFDSLGASSRKNYKSLFNKCNELYEIPIKNIKTSHLQAIIDRNKHLSNVNVLKVLFTHLFEYAIKNDIVEKDYSKFIDVPATEVKKIKKPFTQEEIQILINNKDHQYVDLILVLLYTGMRIAELLDLKIEDVNLPERYMIGGKKTKAGFNRVIPIHIEISKIIEKQIATNKTYLFETSRGNQWAYNYFAAYKFKPLMDQFKMDHTLHETRHTFISQASRLNINQSSIKKIVGHSNGDVTERYTHKNIEELVASIDEFYY